MQKLAKRVPGLDDDLLIWAIIKGFRPFIKASVIQHKAEVTTLADLLQYGKHQIFSQNSDGVTPCGDAKYKWGIKISRLSTNKSLYLAYIFF